MVDQSEQMINRMRNTGNVGCGDWPPLDASYHPYLPCPICHGVEQCDHTIPERRAASLWQKAPIPFPSISDSALLCIVVFGAIAVYAAIIGLVSWFVL